ncbi:MAG: hypothetical protein KF889_17715 [Alphaproteobacteria bacterium]|nr:hypothetical protein [Alphaproteobacteria bacterium]MCW5739792.1 hypothetical protein [Alphaproteobacteria bacterium]
MPTAGAAAAAKPALPPPGSSMAGRQNRANAYAGALPEPLPGWTATTPGTVASDSAMAGRTVAAYRQYRLGKRPANLDSVMIAIDNNRDGSARYPIELWNDEAKRTATSWIKTKVAGRDAMEGKCGAIAELYFLMPNNLFMKLSWCGRTDFSRRCCTDHHPRFVVAADTSRIEYAPAGHVAPDSVLGGCHVRTCLHRRDGGHYLLADLDIGLGTGREACCTAAGGVAGARRHLCRGVA